MTVCGVVEAVPDALEKEPVFVAIEPVPIPLEAMEPCLHTFGSPNVC